MILGKRLLLYLSPRGTLVLSAHWGRLDKLGEYAANEQGLREFSSLLAHHKRCPVTVLVDCVDEDYRLETLPHVGGRARHELLSRKLRQIFRNAQYAAAMPQGRMSEGRRDDRYLMVAISDSDWLQPWIDTLLGHGLPFAGMTLLSVAAENLVRRMKIRDPHVLLVSHQSAGLRLTYLQHGKLRFSRLIRTESHSDAALNVAEDVSKTQLYLTSQRLFPREARMTVYLIDTSAQLAAAQPKLNADPLFEARLLRPADIGRRLGVARGHLTPTPETLYLAALEARFPNLAPRAFSSGYRLHRLKWGLVTAGASALLASSAVAGWSWLQIRADTVEMQALDAAIRRNESAYQETLRHLPQIPLAADALSRVVEAANRIEAGSRTPERVFAPLASVLDRHPEILLESLVWQLPNPADQGEAAVETLEVRARITPFDGNYRAAMDQIHRFAGELRATSTLGDVTLLAAPVDTASNALLSGTTLDRDKIPEAHFTLKLGFKGASS